MTTYTYEIKDFGHGPCLVVTPADATEAKCSAVAEEAGYTCRFAGSGLADDGASVVIPLDEIEEQEEQDPTRTAAAWWAWHDADSSRWGQSAEEAEARCAAWVDGLDGDGPEEQD
jgi:hypothetical protein